MDNNLEEITFPMYLEKTEINLETTVEEKRSLIEKNNGKIALIKMDYTPKKYAMGITKTLNQDSFLLETIGDETKVISNLNYKSLSELIIHSH